MILNVLGPNAKTKNLCQNGVRTGINKICDVTIAYPEGRPLDLFQIVLASRAACVTHVHYRVFDVQDIPEDPEAMRHWMYNLYAEKEKMLEKYYKTGIFPYDMYPSTTRYDASEKVPRGSDASEGAPRGLHHDPVVFLTLHLFFLMTIAGVGFGGYQMLW